ncbi:hypothetical protein ABZ942_09015 [Nocardia sp. NPDC046473]|uniref:hypothetical protein n=1 Tax=Nocardia sp. NPDC046473 TaxID=3155733 RepID=UPI0034086BFD
MSVARVQTHMNEIEYVFGTGDGTVHVWHSQADLELAGPASAAADAIRLDFDGDGFADDAMWDTSGSGIADVAALDLDDDGVLDHFYTDPTGLGTWDHPITGTASDASSEPLGWIVRTEEMTDEHMMTEHMMAEQHTDVGAGQPDSMPAPAGLDADQWPRPDHPSLTDAPPSHRPPDDLSGYPAQWMNPTGRHLDDDPIIT